MLDAKPRSPSFKKPVWFDTKIIPSANSTPPRAFSLSESSELFKSPGVSNNHTERNISDSEKTIAI
ncbi:hypothetical protein PSEHALCIP103_03719 [Pseudoalteromonas haloplanktis]|uniref:Uncharacterized protein n=1 Tax=Pseudoalteromonas haloplanktis TaxID=228 RepID=A0A9W4W7T8_PSEHA|nr:hypothetical protein PSEHALCIP103_03719 [Pseudoalteromonas haloplanktis]